MSADSVGTMCVWNVLSGNLIWPTTNQPTQPTNPTNQPNQPTQPTQLFFYVSLNVNTQQTDGDIEIDMTELDETTLRTLESYVNQCLSESKLSTPTHTYNVRCVHPSPTVYCSRLAVVPSHNTHLP